MFRTPILPAIFAIMLGSLASTAAALGLGGLRAQSALNQPFYAEIALSDVKTDELDTVKARLASREDFSEAGAERPHFLTRLKFTPMIGPSGEAIVQVTSREPIREPYLDFLIEVLWPQGRMVKEYTVLMDPPTSVSTSAPRVSQPNVTAPVRRPPPQPVARARPPE
ncbi:MAG: fimbrial protein FimV, partial [Thiohalocapsa sp.]